MVRAYAREITAALGAVRSASIAALGMQREIAATQAAFQKEDSSGTGFGVSPVTAADFMVQILVIGALARACPSDKFIAEETGAEFLAAGPATRAAVMAALERHSPSSSSSEADALAMLDLGQIFEPGHKPPP